MTRSGPRNIKYMMVVSSKQDIKHPTQSFYIFAHYLGKVEDPFSGRHQKGPRKHGGHRIKCTWVPISTPEKSPSREPPDLQQAVA